MEVEASHVRESPQPVRGPADREQRNEKYHKKIEPSIMDQTLTQGMQEATK